MQAFNQFADMPETVRALMKTNIDESRRAFDAIFSTSQKSWQGFNESAQVAADGFKNLSDKIAGYTRVNLETMLEHARKLAAAREFGDVAALQSAYLRETAERTSRQFQELRELTETIVRYTAHNTSSALTLR